jgi:hypothetical protein
MFSDVAELQAQRRRGFQTLEGKDAQQLDPREGANNVTGSGPATNFRSAATEGVTTWGPVMGGVVAVGGTIAIVGSMLPSIPKAEPYYDSKLQLLTQHA